MENRVMNKKNDYSTNGVIFYFFPSLYFLLHFEVKYGVETEMLEFE